MIPALLLTAVLAAAPQPGARPCIQLADSSITHYHAVDDHTVLIESGRRWYRLTTSPNSLMLQGDSFFVNEIRGTSSLCSRLDFQLTVVDRPGGFREGIIVQDFSEITPEEAKALRARSRR